MQITIFVRQTLECVVQLRQCFFHFHLLSLCFCQIFGLVCDAKICLCLELLVRLLCILLISDGLFLQESSISDNLLKHCHHSTTGRAFFISIKAWWRWWPLFLLILLVLLCQKEHLFVIE